MRAEPTVQAIHATAVAIGTRALLIRGASRAGKSRLAMALIARSTATLPIRLVGDDRILLTCVAGNLIARPHPRIAGFIERRGLGLVAMPWAAQAGVGAVVDLGDSLREPRGVDSGNLAELPRLDLANVADTARADSVLAWWAGLTAAWAQHPFRKADRAALADAKD